MREQSPLEREPATEAGQAAVGADHAMAGHHDRQRVAPVRRADCAHRGGRPDARRDAGVALDRVVRNARERVPDALLEWRTRWRELKFESASGAVEIFAQLLRCGAKQLGTFVPLRPELRVGPPSVERDAGETARGCHEQQPTERCRKHEIIHAAF